MYLDAVKALTICFVLLGHCVQYTSDIDCKDNVIWMFIYSFHMPLFAFVSGLFFPQTLKQNFKCFILKKGKTLLLPVFVWVSLFLCGKALFSLHSGENILNIFHPGAYISSFWFLTALFVCFVYLYVICKITRNPYIRAVLIIVAVLLTPSNTVPFLFPFFVAGAVFSKMSEKLNEHNLSMVIISTIGFVVLLLFWKGDYTFYFTSPRLLDFQTFSILPHETLIYIYRFAIGLFGSIMFILLIRCLHKKYPSFWGNKIICEIGASTLGIYICQRYLLELPLIRAQIMLSTWNSLLFSILMAAVELCICMLLIRSIEHWKWSRLLLLGKK